MHRLSTTQPFTCASCDVEIVGPAVIHVGLPFCCAGCVAGGPCMCSYDLAEARHEEAAVARSERHVEAAMGRPGRHGAFPNEAPVAQPVLAGTAVD